MRSIVSVLLLLVGCSCGATGGAPSTSTSTSTTGSGASPAPVATGYSVHEWGLVRAQAGDTLRVGAMGPEILEELMAVEKPVLYFHADGAFDVTRVRVEAHGGSVVEHWPHTGAGATSTTIEWTGLHLVASASLLMVPGSCPLVLPTAAEAPCVEALATTGECETLSLARAVAADATCVHLGSGTAPFLFYRSTSNALTAPLSAFYLDFGDINVRNDGDLPIPGRLLRFQRDGGDVRVVVVDPPAPHTTIVVGHDWAGPDAARAAVTSSLTELGLTEGEAGAFLAAWDAAFFGAGESAVEETPEIVERMPAEEELPPEDSILYFLPAADVERVATLTFEPTPTEVRRALAVWTALR